MQIQKNQTDVYFITFIEDRLVIIMQIMRAKNQHVVHGDFIRFIITLLVWMLLMRFSVHCDYVCFHLENSGFR